MNGQLDHSVSMPFLRSRPVATIAIAQLCGTSLWFSANSAAPDLMRAWGIGVSGIGLLTNAVQLGFILGTSAFALSGLADRFPASRTFVLSAFLGALFNGCFALFSNGIVSAAALRFLVGICLAGIYPIGMKLVVSWAPKKTGPALAYLVGMLTLGTALPQGVRFLGASWNWRDTILTSSGLAVAGAFLVFLLGDGPISQSDGKLTLSAWEGLFPRFARDVFVQQRLATLAICGNSIHSGRWCR